MPDIELLRKLPTVNSYSCSSNNFDLTAVATGGTSPYTYLWGDNSSNATLLNAGDYTYSVTAADFNGCSTTASYTGNYQYINSLTFTSTDPCNNTSNGKITPNFNGGLPFNVPPLYTYAWSNTSTNISIQSGLPAGTYSLTVTDATLVCSVSGTVILTALPALGASISGGATPLCYNTSPGTFTATGTGGTGSYTYQWFNGAGSVAGANASTYNPGSLTSSNGFYCAITSGSCGSVSTSISEITMDARLTAQINNSRFNITKCYSGTATTLTATGAGGTGSYTYQWYNGSGAIGGATASTYSTGVLTSSMNYYCDVTDAGVLACGTVSSPTVSIEKVTATVTGPSTSCSGNAPGTLTATGGGSFGTSYSYHWYDNSNGTYVATTSTYAPGSLTSTSIYTCTVSDATCNATATTTISVSSILVSLTPSSISCNTNPWNPNSGSITSSVTAGNSPYTYVWNDAATTSGLSNIPVGNYTVTVTDASACVATATVAITYNITAILSAENCNSPDGNMITSIDALPSCSGLTYTYTWAYGPNPNDNAGYPVYCDIANGTTNASGTIVPLIPGYYDISVTVTNVTNGVTSTTTAILNGLNDIYVPNYNVLPDIFGDYITGISYTLSDIYSYQDPGNGAYVYQTSEPNANPVVTSLITPLDINNPYPAFNMIQAHFEGQLVIDQLPSPYATYSLNGNQDASLFSVNSHLTFGPGAEVVVGDGTLFYVDGGTLEGCDTMWKGIALKSESTCGNATNRPSIELIGTNGNGGVPLRISDAMFAVEYPRYSFSIVDGVNFDRNFVGLYLPSTCTEITSGPYLNNIQGYVGGSNFHCSNGLKKYFDNTDRNCITNQPDFITPASYLPSLPNTTLTYPDNEGAAGIWFWNLEAYGAAGFPITSGQTGQVNQFHNIAIGAFFMNSTIFFSGNEFYNLPTSPSADGLVHPLTSYTGQVGTWVSLPSATGMQGYGVIASRYPHNINPFNTLNYSGGGGVFPATDFDKISNTGIFVNSGNLYAQNVYTQFVGSAITVQNDNNGTGQKKVAINGCNLGAYFYGISLLEAGPYNDLEIGNTATNTITISPPAGYKNGEGIVFKQIGFTWQPTITNFIIGSTNNSIGNDITMNNGVYGIDVNGGQGLQVLHNNINMNNQAYSPSSSTSYTNVTVNPNAYAGININNYNNLIVGCNIITGISDWNANNGIPYGIFSLTAAANSLSVIGLNKIDQFGTGIDFYFADPLLYAEKNILLHSNIGLHIENNAVVSKHRFYSNANYSTENDWSGFSGSYGAENDGNNLQIFSETFYSTGGSDLPSWYCPNALNGNTWFQPTANTLPTSIIGATCPSTNFSIVRHGQLDDVDRAIAVDSFTIGDSTDFAGPIKELHQRYLLDKLMADQALIDSDSVYTNFMVRIKQSPVYAYWRIDSMIIANDTMPATLTGQMDSFYRVISNADSILSVLDSSQLIQASIITLHDTIMLKGYAVDSINVVLPHGGDSSLQSQVSSYRAISAGNRSALNTLQNNWLQSLSTTAAAIDSVNTATFDTSQYESYQQSVKTIYLHSLGAGIDTLAPGDSATLYAIANLCPYAGGTSIYDAQALYSLISPQSFFDFNCDNRSERMLARKPPVPGQTQLIKLYPNPANDKLTMEWQSDSIQSGRVLVEDLLGRTLLTLQVQSNTGPQFIDVSRLTDGTYILLLEQSERLIYQNKVVIIK